MDAYLVQGVGAAGRFGYAPGSRSAGDLGGQQPYVFVLARLPRPLLHALRGRVPAAVYQTVLCELRRRTPEQLAERAERRWYQRWAHVPCHLNADDIALQLVAPRPCPVPDCEDGVRLTTDRVCGQCHQSAHRFVPHTTEPVADEQVRANALAAIRAAVRSSPYRTGAGIHRTRKRSVAIAEMDRALAQARKRLAGPDALRALAPPGQRESGISNSIILAARAQRLAAERDPVRRAAIARARTERQRRAAP